MTRLSITIDQELLEEAKRASKSKTSREAVEKALQEMVQRRRIEGLLALLGSDAIDMTPEELRAWRDMSIPEEW